MAQRPQSKGRKHPSASVRMANTVKKATRQRCWLRGERRKVLHVDETTMLMLTKAENKGLGAREIRRIGKPRQYPTPTPPTPAELGICPICGVMWTIEVTNAMKVHLAHCDAVDALV